MRRPHPILITSGVLIFAVLAFYAFLLWSFSFDPLCSDTVLSEVVSPDGVVKATVDEIDCGTTTDYSYNVLVHGERRMFELEDGGVSTVFIGDQDSSRTDGVPSLNWTDNRTLLIRYPKRMSVFKAVKSANGVRITYSSP